MTDGLIPRQRSLNPMDSCLTMHGTRTSNKYLYYLINKTVPEVENGSPE